jgi:bifunctional DNase/RNase
VRFLQSGERPCRPSTGFLKELIPAIEGNIVRKVVDDTGKSCYHAHILLKQQFSSMKQGETKALCVFLDDQSMRF